MEERQEAADRLAAAAADMQAWVLAYYAEEASTMSLSS